MYDDTNDSDSCNRKTACAAAAISLHASQPPDKRQRLLCTSATTTASPEEPSTCNESFASNDAVASVEHNQSKPFCCGYTPDVPSPTTGSVRQYVWSYHYFDCIQSVHPSQTLTEEEVLKYALRKEEYVGVFGKEYAAKNQERRLAMDLTKLLVQLPTPLSFGAILL